MRPTTGVTPVKAAVRRACPSINILQAVPRILSTEYPWEVITLNLWSRRVPAILVPR